MSLPALEDIAGHAGTAADAMDGVYRIETSPREKATPVIMEMMRSVYPHNQVFGQYYTVNAHIDCPPDELYDCLAHTRSMEEWTYSLRGFTPTDEQGPWLADDRLGSDTQIYTSAAPCSRSASRSTSRMAGFAHAGDFAGAAAIQWGGRPS
jgi:hypothetical protein